MIRVEHLSKSFGKRSASLEAVHDISFAFAFHAFHPEAPIYTEIE